jgi:hypothetical protein
MQTAFCLRLNESVDEIESALAIVLGNMDKGQPYLVVRETGENDQNPHFHFAGHLADGHTIQSLRTRLNRLGIKGNEAYSLKKGDANKMDTHFTYLCKGASVEAQPEIIARSPYFEDVVVQDRHETFWQVNAQLPKKKRKTESVSAADAISRICFDTMNHNGGQKLLEDDIIDIAVDWVHKNRKTLNDFYLRSLINHVCYTVNKGSQETGDGWDSNRMTQLRNKLKYQTF